MMGRLLAATGLAAIGLFALSCSSPPDSNTTQGSGSTDITVSTLALSSADIVDIVVTISGPRITPDIVVTLHGNPASGWQRTVGNIPAGDNRTFAAEAFDSSGQAIYRGSATNVTIVNGGSVGVAIFVQQIASPTPLANTVPRFSSLVISGSTVAPEGTVSLIATATDPDVSDTLSYQWSAGAGAFSDSTSASTVWTAPTVSGSYTLSATVTDSKHATTSLDVAIDVQVYHGRGRAGVSVTVNTSPEVASLVPSPTRIDVGETTLLALTASDSDGDVLGFAWSASCSGSFSSPTAEDPSFTLTASNAGADCTLSVVISDGRGGSNDASIVLQTGPAVSASAGFTSTTDMGIIHGGSDAFAVAVLDDGRVLVTGGSDWVTTNPVAEIYEPALGTWTPVAPMSAVRTGHSATLMADGRVLVAGGYSASGQVNSAEIYDPVSDTWTPTGSMASVRSGHYAVLLGNGQVMVAGGGIHNPSDTIGTASVELYNPQTGAWSSTGSMNSPRMSHRGVLLSDGRVLVAGGVPQGVTTTNYASAELYDPVTGAWSYTNNSMTVGRRGGFSLVLLGNGTVLAAGGCVAWTSRATDLADLFDPSSNAWAATTAMPATRQAYSATLLSSGKVLFAGGNEHPADYNLGTILNTAVLFDPVAGTWTSVASSMVVSRHWHHAVSLLDGQVLLLGGYTPSGSSHTPTKTCELYREQP